MKSLILQICFARSLLPLLLLFDGSVLNLEFVGNVVKDDAVMHFTSHFDNQLYIITIIRYQTRPPFIFFQIL